MRLQCLLFIYSLFAAIAAASYQKLPTEERDVKRKPLKGTSYEVEKLPSKVPYYWLYGKGYMDGLSPLAKVIYSPIGLSKKPVLHIWAAGDIGSQDKRTMSLSNLIKDLTAQETKVKLDRVPYVTFEDVELENVGLKEKIHNIGEHTSKRMLFRL
ncbi:hypothetical protein LZ32DRAFT_660015 [Colletotrichum eremochloae]|nr:hypothetical protein LZ32DRAFT_660015 [Colletotrichum eremochloae]